MRATSRRGFTITEVLVACLIVLVLAAVITAAVVRARDASKDIACRENLSQLGKALLLYASEYDGFVPPYLTNRVGSSTRSEWVRAAADRWRASLEPYTKTGDVFFCPRDGIRGLRGVRWDSTITSYETIGLQRKDEIGKDGSYRMNLEDNQGSKTAYTQDRLFPDVEHGKPSWWLSLHGESANFLFLDCHVEKRPINESPQ